ncbi:PTS sugar transporter subunit IIA [Pseudoroseomonas cervicalis]|uniref:PTS sugar transporter subunit IIA n=1 Tax=Teichococcus cervicalis TaxID=204525 RepID=UPI0022F1A7C3|nr:PTS sugar transporter subunit IIA [Pseudoroseomonas cervicalis]WBV45313.1 PTS sugar transporter subunit IIA [Pseudoroseomonas cervicalis]
MPLDLLDLIDETAICLDLQAGSAAEVIALLAARLHAQGAVAASYAEAVLAREAVMPTGLPLGAINVAVPHTDAHHVRRPAVALAVLRQPVPFGNMEDPDEQLPVQIVLALALNDKHAQIEALQTVAGLIQAPELLQALLAAPDIPTVRQLLRALNKDRVHG